MTQDKWQELLPTLLGNVTGEFEERVKVATLQALGYMCDDVSPPPREAPLRVWYYDEKRRLVCTSTCRQSCLWKHQQPLPSFFRGTSLSTSGSRRT